MFILLLLLLKDVVVVVVVVVVFKSSLFSLFFFVTTFKVVLCKSRPGLVFVESRRDAFNFGISFEKLLNREMLASGHGLGRLILKDLSRNESSSGRLRDLNNKLFRLFVKFFNDFFIEFFLFFFVEVVVVFEIVSIVVVVVKVVTIVVIV